MTITLNGTTGITTPDITSSGSLNIDASAPDNSLVVNSSGKVGIGTSSPANTLHISADTPAILIQDANSVGTAATGVLDFVDSAATRLGYIGYASGVNSDLDINVTQSGRMDFSTNNTLRARIDAGGSLLVGTTSTANAAKVEINFDGSAANGIVLQTTRAATGSVYALFINSAGGTAGQISQSGTSTVSYTTSSDYRLKTAAQPMTGASARVQALKPVNFAWIADGSRVDGFLAHEAAEVVPEAVTGTKDATEMVDITDEEGNVTGQEERPVYQGIDQSKLVPLLTAALQEALAAIDDLTARVSALEAK
mgnify:CR=1 FL=1